MIKFSIVWTTKKFKSLFRIKDNVNHLSCIIHKENCSRGSKYIGEIFRNSRTRFSDHKKLSGISEPLKHVKNNTEFEFSWKVTLRGLSSCFHREILESYFIKQLNPSLNDHFNSEILMLSRHDVI